MQLPLDELDHRLDSLDDAIALMVEDGMDRTDLLAVVACAADEILAFSGSNRDYVSARLLDMLVANGLGSGPSDHDGPT